MQQATRQRFRRFGISMMFALAVIGTLGTSQPARIVPAQLIGTSRDGIELTTGEPGATLRFDLVRVSATPKDDSQLIDFDIEIEFTQDSAEGGPFEVQAALTLDGFDGPHETLKTDSGTGSEVIRLIGICHLHGAYEAYPKCAGTLALELLDGPNVTATVLVYSYEHYEGPYHDEAPMRIAVFTEPVIEVP